MPRLLACPHCQSHALTTESQCPHCGGSLRARNGRLALTTAAVLMGLTPMACEKGGSTAKPPEDSGGVAEPEYGVPVTDGQDSPNDDLGEPEYGVPVTDQPVSPMYGVPDGAPLSEEEP